MGGQGGRSNCGLGMRLRRWTAGGQTPLDRVARSGTAQPRAPVLIRGNAMRRHHAAPGAMIAHGLVKRRSSVRIRQEAFDAPRAHPPVNRGFSPSALLAADSCTLSASDDLRSTTVDPMWGADRWAWECVGGGRFEAEEAGLAVLPKRAGARRPGEEHRVASLGKAVPDCRGLRHRRGEVHPRRPEGERASSGLRTGATEVVAGMSLGADGV